MCQDDGLGVCKMVIKYATQATLMAESSVILQTLKHAIFREKNVLQPIQW